jgi:O-antigen/teichoic acid export membrane protein
MPGPAPPRNAKVRAALGAVRHHTLAGLLDASLASLATFVVGIYAVRAFDPVTLGGYALAYQAVFLVGIAPAYLILAPAEIAVVAYPVERRLDYLPRTMGRAAPIALAAALASALWAVVVPSELPADATIALAATAALTAFVSPLQDHVRQMLHSGGASWRAASVSLVQLVVVVVAVGAMVGLAIPPAWIPFGALGFANVASAAVGVALSRNGRLSPAAGTLRFAHLLASGRWIFGGAILGPAAGFVVAALVLRLASAEALGYAEGARVVSQPVWVLAVGLSSVLGPRSMAAARERRLDTARAISRRFVALILLAGAGSVAAVGGAWPWNPLRWLLPNAYTVPGLTLLMLASQTALAVLFPYRSELLGAQREAALTKVELGATGARVAVALTAGATGTYAIPLGFLAQGGIRAAAYQTLLRRVYATPGLPAHESERSEGST